MTDLDVIGRVAADGARREVASVDLPDANDVTTRRAGRRRRQRFAVALTAAAVVVGAVFAVAVFRPRDSVKLAVVATPTTTSAVLHPAAALEFRGVRATMPIAGCKLTADRPASSAVLPDRTRSACYVVGPVALDGASVESADAAVDPTTSEWEVNVHFRNDDFVSKVAIPYVDNRIAIVVDGVVQSAPTVNRGITGRDVTISGAFSRVEAENLARRLGP